MVIVFIKKKLIIPLAIPTPERKKNKLELSFFFFFPEERKKQSLELKVETSKQLGIKTYLLKEIIIDALNNLCFFQIFFILFFILTNNIYTTNFDINYALCCKIDKNNYI